MKVSLKDNKWVFKFDTTTIICAITKIKGVYTVLFELDSKVIKITTQDLDKTFLSLEQSFNLTPISSYR
jgi:hypothetical protein